MITADEITFFSLKVKCPTRQNRQTDGQNNY